MRLLKQHAAILFLSALAIGTTTIAYLLVRDKKMSMQNSQTLQYHFDALENDAKRTFYSVDSDDCSCYRDSEHYNKILSYKKISVPYLLDRLPAEEQLKLMPDEVVHVKVNWIICLLSDIYKEQEDVVSKEGAPGEPLTLIWRRWLKKNYVPD